MPSQSTLQGYDLKEKYIVNGLDVTRVVWTSPLKKKKYREMKTGQKNRERL